MSGGGDANRRRRFTLRLFVARVRNARQMHKMLVVVALASVGQWCDGTNATEWDNLHSHQKKKADFQHFPKPTTNTTCLSLMIWP